MNSYPILNKYEDIICIKMNQNYNFIILLLKYFITPYVINNNIFKPMFKPILYIIKNYMEYI